MKERIIDSVRKFKRQSLFSNGVKLISSVFYLGYLPLGGTLVSILAIGIYFLLKDLVYIYLSLTVISVLLGFLVCSQAEKLFRQKDSKKIVIDDFCGMLSSLIFSPKRLEEILGIFLIFRILDVLKPYPAGRLEKIKGAKGIMFDDLTACLYTNLIFLSLKNYFKFT